MNVGGVTVVSKDANIQYHLFNYHKSRTDEYIYIYEYYCIVQKMFCYILLYFILNYFICIIVLKIFYFARFV